MSNEFCFIHHCPDNILSNIESHFYVESLSAGALILRGNTNTSKYVNKKYTAYLIGNVYNIVMFKTILAHSESQVWTLNDAEVFCLLRERLGDNAMTLAEGSFCLFIAYHNGTVEVITEARGLNLISLVQTEHHWVTNSLKIVSHIAGEDAFDFLSEKKVIDNLHKADNFSPAKNIIRLKPGTITKLLYDEQHYFYTENRRLSSPQKNSILTLPENTLYDLIDINLRGAISSWVNTNESIGIPLSGGLDSSLITALACQHFPKVKTWSIGTELSDEFTFAKMVSDALSTEHEVKILTEDDILSGVAEAIYYNEIFDGRSSEIQSGLFNIYKLASSKVTSLLTGYGADLLFGGILNPDHSDPNPNAILAEEIYRTKWTGEFSSCGATKYNLNVYHPFWCNSMISLCEHLDPYFKCRNNEVKNILREYAENLKTLPAEIIRRKKIGIHEGSSVNHVFARAINTDVNNYQEKTKFSYSIYKAFLNGHLSIEDISSDKLRSIFKRSKS